ncbi:DUF2946 family protein [Chitinasiproducens palmae]|uniref:DUF2946 family protein n=1 Tax=Chitinasiproducens palmae TaxID=1770053 RepID=A0A1H2PW87_9BURK|nr:DUF2946 family protein [Chitinasiproducens palmae]SDV51638.1 Protein of unknown function [Chitinasiproducens palmae]
MDENVKRALEKWPNVPACTGWLLLDRRGAWRMRDEAVQAAGGLGEPIRHAQLNEFIGRNYLSDAHGRWFFQNGPQRVFVELAYAPWIVRLMPVPAGETGHAPLRDQTGAAFTPLRCWLVDDGNVVFEGRRGDDGALQFALLHDHDLGPFTERMSEQDGDTRWQADDGTLLPLAQLAEAEIEQRFGFVRHPSLALPADEDVPASR